jgi:hypothetical protein
MASSKFSSPFFKKSPLLGAYSSGADGMVTVSYDDVHQKFQDGIAENVAKAYAPKDTACSNLEQKLSDGKIKEGAYNTLVAKCGKQDDEDSDYIVDLPELEGPFEGQVGLSDYKKSNETNPFYVGRGYKGSGMKIDLPELPDLG